MLLPTYNDEEVCEKIKNAIKRKGLNYAQVAEMMGTKKQYVYAILSHARPITAEKIIEFSFALGLSLDYLIYGTKNILKYYPDIKNECNYSSMTFVDSPTSEIIISAKNHAYKNIKNICEKDYLVIDKSQTDAGFLTEKLVLVEFPDETTILARVKPFENLFIFYFDNDKPPIIANKFKILGVVRKIIREV